MVQDLQLNLLRAVQLLFLVYVFCGLLEAYGTVELWGQGWQTVPRQTPPPPLCSWDRMLSLVCKFLSQTRTHCSLPEAEYCGSLKPGQTIIEPMDALTVDSGLAVASVAASKGYPCVLVMPSDVPVTRQETLRRLGARIVHTDWAAGILGARAHAEDLVASSRGKYHMVGLFTAAASVRAHELTTAVEIWEGTGGKVDIFVAGVLTGATLTGMAPMGHWTATGVDGNTSCPLIFISGCPIHRPLPLIQRCSQAGNKWGGGGRSNLRCKLREFL